MATEEEWRALVVEWSIRCETMAEALLMVAERHATDHILIDRIDKVLSPEDPPLVPGQPEPEPQSDG